MGGTKFTAGSVDWRAVLKENGRKTQAVMVTFVLIYTALGVMTDILIAIGLYPQLTINQAFQLLIQLQIFPYATLSMFVVALMALLITIKLHDKIMLMGTDYYEVTPDTARDIAEKQLYNVVEEMKVSAGLRFMPKIYLIEANYMNALASGFSEKSAMVAITRGLMTKLNRAELQAVMAHELSHVRHQDIKLTLMVGVLSNLMLMVVDILFYNVIFGQNQNSDSGRGNPLTMIIILLRYGLPLVTVLLMLYLSRTREYMADMGAVELMRENESLAKALLKIQEDHENHVDEYHEEYGRTRHEEFRNAAYIFEPSAFDPVKSMMTLLSTHPSVEDRLKAMGCHINHTND